MGARLHLHDGAAADVAVAGHPQHLAVRDDDGGIALRLPRRLLQRRAMKRKRWLLPVIAAGAASR